MTANKKLLAAVLVLLVSALCRAESPSNADILKRIMDRIKQNDELTEEYGYYYQAQFRELDGDGDLVKEEKRLYRIVWVEGKQYFELMRIDDRDLSAKDKAEEVKRRNKFIESVRKKQKSELNLGWDEMFPKYNYTLLPADGEARYVVAFEPKKDGLKERTRMEKVFNHINGKVWVDADYNVMKANVWLSGDVKFGLGILGSLNELELQYSQQKFEDRVWLPSKLHLNYRVRVLVKNKQQQMDSRFYDPYPRSGIK